MIGHARRSGAEGAGASPPAGGTARGGEDLQAVWQAYRLTGETGLRNRLVEAYLYIVRMVGNRIASRLPRSIDVQDLRSAGVFGLLKAIDNYNHELGTPFESYCALRVRGAILDELRAQDWVPRLVRTRAGRWKSATKALRDRLHREPTLHEIADHLEVGVDEAARLERDANLTSVYTLTTPDEGDADPRLLRRLDALMDRASEAPFEQLVAHDLAHSLMKILSKPERTVVALYYQERLTMREIGQVMGISESRVCQIHTKTLRRLKEHLNQVDKGAESPPTPVAAITG